MRRHDLHYANDAQQHLLADDRAAAVWWTYKPPPQVVANSLPAELPHVREGSGRWLPPPAVRAADAELQSPQSSSPGFSRMSESNFRSTLASSPRTFHKRDWSRLPTDVAASAGPGSFDNSLLLPSMNGSDGFSLTNEAGQQSVGGGSPALSPHGRRRHFEPERAVPAAAAHSFDEWMREQAAPSLPARGNARTSFAERVHSEGLGAAPTPFTDGPNPSPRRAANGALQDASPRPSPRMHHPELFPVGERPSHPREACARDREVAAYGGGMGEAGAQVGDSHWAEGAAGTKGVLVGPGGAPDGHHARHSTELTQGFHMSGGVMHWSEPGHAAAIAKQRYMKDASSASAAAVPPPAPPSTDFAADAHRRGRSDLHYIISPRHERAEYAAREREAAKMLDAHAYRRTATVATVPEIDEMRRRKATMANDTHPVSVGLTSTDIHADASAREWRLQQRAAERQQRR